MKEMIGLEVHCQLKTVSKMFCACTTEHKGAVPNSVTCPVCLGLPGTKPLVNKSAIELGMLIAMALNCRISPSVMFSRKTYFYPDLAKNYQITQYGEPLGTGGHLDVGEVRIRIREVHLEEDPAKLAYANGDITNSEYVLADYNRSGLPLAEIVTEPDFTSPRQARQFMEKLSAILEHLNVYDPTGEAAIRADANISTGGGARVEVKNVTGFENVEKALSFEIVRQNGMARMGVEVQRETRHFDSDTSSTKSLRKKEYEEDYGYIFDPDIPVIPVSGEWAERVRATMPELPDHRLARMATQYGIGEYAARVLVYTDKHLADFFEECCKRYKDPHVVARWMTNYLMKSLNWRSERISQSKVRVDTFVEFLNLLASGAMGDRYAKELIKEYVDTGLPPKDLLNRGKAKAREMDLDKMIDEELSANQNAAEEYRSGKAEALQFLIGGVLKRTGRRGDPKLIREKLLEILKP